MPTTPNIVTPTSISTPNVARNNDKNLLKSVQVEQEETQIETDKTHINRIKESLDLYVGEAERLYYNCDYQNCCELTELILKEDPYHSGCLPIHISCQVELKQSVSKFKSLKWFVSSN